MKHILKKIYFHILFILCLLFSLTTICDNVYAAGFGRGECPRTPTSVPEPSTLLLLAAGAGAFYFIRKKNKK